MAAGHVIVVGGGLAGLSAAVELKQQGLTVDLYERSRLLGGKATSFEVDGVEVDNGQHVILGCCTEFINFVELVAAMSAGKPEGLPAGQTLTLQKRFEATLLSSGCKPGRIRAVSLPAPFHLLPGLLRYGQLRVTDRLRVGLALARARQPARGDESFDAWLRRHGQTAATRRAFWDPFFVPAMNASLDAVAAEDALFVIRTAFLEHAGAARFGFSRVPLARIAEAAAGLLDGVYLRSPVVGLAFDERHEVNGIVLDNDRIIEADAVILAVPPVRLTRILGMPEEFGVCGLDGFRPAPIVDVHLWYETPSIGFGFAAMLDSPVQWVFEKAPGYLCCSLSAADTTVGMTNAELVELCHQELATVLPQLEGVSRLRGAATRDRDATFISAPGLRRPGVATLSPRLAVAGAWTDTGWPATMESAVRSGRAAARHLVANAPWTKSPLLEPLGVAR